MIPRLGFGAVACADPTSVRKATPVPAAPTAHRKSRRVLVSFKVSSACEIQQRSRPVPIACGQFAIAIFAPRYTSLNWRWLGLLTNYSRSAQL